MSRQIIRLVWVSLFTLTASAAFVTAQPEGKEAKKEPSKEASTPAAATLSLRLSNGTVLQDAILVDAVEMETKLGKLTIPANEIVRIDFGFRLSDEDTKKVEQALKDLGSANQPRRELASKTLAGMGKLAYPVLMAHRKGGDPEVQRRVEELLKDIKSRYPVESLFTRRTDILKTADSTVSGQITSATLNVKCEIFGDVKIPLWRLRELRSTAPGGDVVIAVDAGKHGHNQGWLATEFELTPGDRVDITASGEINLDPQNRLGGGRLETRNVKPQGTTGLTSGEMFIPGQLVGRIGLDGPQFVIGKGMTLNPTREGKLYLRIITIYHADKITAEGSYSVRIAADPQGEAIRPEPIFGGKKGGKGKGFKP